MNRNDEPQGHDRRRPAPAGQARGPGRNRSAQGGGTPRNSQYSHRHNAQVMSLLWFKRREAAFTVNFVR